jgi:opacity protein-like surface antigen
MRKLTCIARLAALVVVATPTMAWADWLLTPYVGGLLLDISDTGTRPVVGGSISWMGTVAGFEVDLGDGPQFLESKPGLAIDKSNLLTLMANVVVGFPAASSRIRPYAAGGIGLVQTNVTMPSHAFEIDERYFGFNLGGGLTVLFNERVGLRGDFRYYRAVQRDDVAMDAHALGISDLKFLRSTIGVTFKF